ncbi:MAG: hypothetical protein AAF171_11720 [Cyanobacteria bacterium P01_A01_bin.116]
MVLPLQTWKHPESKRLWPLLGGLSVLAHIGAMGFSLPYLLELMQPSGDRTAAIPIEMVVVDPDQQPAVPSSNQTNHQTSTTSSNRVAKTDPADSAPPEPKAATDNVARPSAIRSATNNEATSVQPSATTAPSEPNATETASNAVDNEAARTEPSEPTGPSTSNDATDSSSEVDSNRPATPTGDDEPASQEPDLAENSSADTPNTPSSNNELSGGEEGNGQTADNGGTGAGSSPSSTNQTDVTDNAQPESQPESESESPAEEASPPLIENGEPLAEPETEGNTTEQVAALRLMGTEIDVVQDVKDKPPTLISQNNAIELQPTVAGCPLVTDFALGPLPYRLAISAEGSLQTVTPLSAGEAQSAIACLIQSAGFEFEAAMSDGTPVTDDSLLIIVDVIESKLAGPDR